MNEAEIHVVMMRRLTPLVKRHKLKGSYSQRPGDVPCFVPEGRPFEIVADPKKNRFDLWELGGLAPIKLGTTEAELVRKLKT